MEATGQPVRLRDARLKALTKLLPAVLAFSLVDAVLLTVYFWAEVDHLFLTVWLAAVTVHTFFWSVVLVRLRLGERWMIGLSLAEASLFSVFLLAAFPVAGPEKAVLLAAFAMGLLAAGGLSKMSMPVPAVVFLVTQALGSGLSVLGTRLPSLWLLEVFLFAFTSALTVLVFSMSKVFDGRVLAEEELDRQKSLVSHLLTDFEESASEGLWETGVDGRLVSVSARLAQVLGAPAEALLNQPLIPRYQVAEALGPGVPFRNLVVAFELGESRRWWSLTGKPLKDDDGRIVGWRGVGSDVTVSRQRELEMLRLSRHDALTGLLNRHAFRDLLDDLFVHAGPPAARCLALVDVVGFKDVNEARGHAFGDALLQAVADRLVKSVPEWVLVARLDGDEFALLIDVPQSLQETRRDLETILRGLMEPLEPDGGRFEAGFRIGASFSPQDAVSAEQWLKCADLALRSAKTLGRNRLVWFTPDLLESFRRHNTLRDDLKGAMVRGELWVAYQPIVDLNSSRVKGFEALARWNHPRHGPIAPSDFIPLAEESELILALGLWVLGQACQEAKAWPDDVSVNVSGLQLRLGTLADDVASVLSQFAFNPRRLILEVTESALVKDDPKVGTTLASLKAQGIRLALDDFGTGYSALAYLQNFPFDKLKIDQSFVRPLQTGTQSATLLAAIVALAASLGLSTTAEGIEDQAYLDILKDLGCLEGQGYLFSRPVPADQVPQLLASPVHS
jgi:diguanylate cyclase (GGDEF)-like protein